MQKNLQIDRSISSLKDHQRTLASDIRYDFQMCHSQNRSYLEDDIRAMPLEYIRPHDNEWTRSIPMKCVQFAQNNFRGSFAKCETEDSRPTTNASKPCMSEAYVTLVYNAFHDVMDCFDLDPKDFFLQIMIESGFHINAINKTGLDSGMAQFTAAGLRKVIENNRIERTRRILFESSRPSCQRISNRVGNFDITAFVVAKRCSVIKIPQNPYRAMFFNYIHTMLDQVQIQSEIDQQLSEFSSIQTALTPRIRRQLTYLAYNRGLDAIKKLLKGYVDNRQRLGVVPDEADLDLNQNLSRAKSILRLDPGKRDILKRAKIKKLTFAEYAVINRITYVSDMVEAQDYIKNHLGDQCSRL